MTAGKVLRSFEGEKELNYLMPKTFEILSESGPFSSKFHLMHPMINILKKCGRI